FFFFFQAEDGIRDLYVTGVQTCALPISALFGTPRRIPESAAASSCRGFSPASTWNIVAQQATVGAIGPTESRVFDSGNAPSRGRSEERRVGKECRSRRSPYH